jgi:acyl-CoA synthetase (NDP forming)
MLTKLFSPRSIAIIGVSSRSVRFGGSSFLARLLEARFAGAVYPIHPKSEEIQGIKAYPDLTSLPEIPDLAIVSLAAVQVPAVLESCGRIGVQRVHILSSGFSETGTTEGRALERQIAGIAEHYQLQVVGPNCMGPYCPGTRLTAYGVSPGLIGRLGIISQSGGLTQRLTEYAASLNVGVSKAISMGNGTVLDVCDYLEFMANDDETDLIALYLEQVRDSRRFLTQVSAITPIKPIILLKAGRSEAGARTVGSHTGAMAGNRQIWEAVSRQTRLVTVRSLDEWMDTIMAFYHLPPLLTNGVFIASAGGGMSAINSDLCTDAGLSIPPLTQQTRVALTDIVSAVGSIVGNPLDSFDAVFHPQLLFRVIDQILPDPNIGLVMVDQLVPRGIYHLTDQQDRTAEIVRQIRSRPSAKPIVFSVDGEGCNQELTQQAIRVRRTLCDAGIPAFPSLERSARALGHVYRYYHRQTP